ncbi:MAG: class I SAM-dependent methyltransferase [Pseudomonadota bacterium]
MVDPILLMCHQDIYARVEELLWLRNEPGRNCLLDLGCGNARYRAPCLKRLPPTIYEGVDLSEAALAEA